MQLYAMDPAFTDQYLSRLENASHEDRVLALDRFGNEENVIISRREGSNTAYVDIKGPLSPSGPSPLARFFGFGGTGYNEIISAMEDLKNDASIDTVILVMSTPGGTVDGMDQARQAIERLAIIKNVIAENHGMIASAGYHLATAADSIVAMSPLAVTGSIGVIMAGLDFSGAMEREGVKKIRIVSKNAPDKAPDATTERGSSLIQEQINAMERVFIKAVADGRDTTEADVIANFGKGGIFIAQDPDKDQPDALSIGMIDSVQTGGASADEGDPTQFQDLAVVDAPWDERAAAERVSSAKEAFLWYNSEESGASGILFADIVDGKMVANIQGLKAAEDQLANIPDADRPKVQAHIERYRAKWHKNGGGGNTSQTEPAQGGKNDRGPIMDLKALKAEHPAIYAEAVEAGVNQERERVEAHITMGEASGDIKLAIGCIKDGAEFSAKVNANYMAAGMNKNAAEARGDEAPGDINTPVVADADTQDDAVAKALAELTGVQDNG
mgnify:CR=1 FL=1